MLTGHGTLDEPKWCPCAAKLFLQPIFRSVARIQEHWLWVQLVRETIESSKRDTSERPWRVLELA